MGGAAWVAFNPLALVIFESVKVLFEVGGEDRVGITTVRNDVRTVMNKPIYSFLSVFQTSMMQPRTKTRP